VKLSRVSRRVPLAVCSALMLAASLSPAHRPQISAGPENVSSRTYLGFDRNEYPGDVLMKSLTPRFSFVGYWVNDPPGARANPWVGKRSVLRDYGFGFLVLSNGRMDRELGQSGDPAKLGRNDSRAAVASALKEGFPRSTIIFLDQEEGGRLLAEQNEYLFAWIDGVVDGGFQAGVYCSGMSASEQGQEVPVTANDIHSHARNREIEYFVYNDACPPSPGCASANKPPQPSSSGVPFASVWQFAQSPRRRAYTSHCTSAYNPDGNCYSSGAEGPGSMFLDLDSATSFDPSHGR
jgi:hypothetical protein